MNGGQPVEVRAPGQVVNPVAIDPPDTLDHPPAPLMLRNALHQVARTQSELALHGRRQSGVVSCCHCILPEVAGVVSRYLQQAGDEMFIRGEGRLGWGRRWLPLLLALASLSVTGWKCN